MSSIIVLRCLYCACAPSSRIPPLLLTDLAGDLKCVSDEPRILEEQPASRVSQAVLIEYDIEEETITPLSPGDVELFNAPASDTMSTPQEISALYASLYCSYAVFALLVYDWLLCIGKEARFIWNWHSRATGSSLVYAFSRYAVLASNLLSIMTTYPMSDLSCRAVGWSLIAVTIMGTIAFGAFSALRAYALSDRKIWLAGVIILLALPPPMIDMFQGSKSHFENLASPFNCSISSSLSPALSIRVNLVSRASQLVAELLVVTITWWYNYQSSHVWKDSIKLRRSLSSLLIYNGSIYFLFFASWYVLDIVLNVAPVPPEVLFVDELLVSIFYDPITSILVCRFILSLRQFHSRTTSATYQCSGMRFSCVGEHPVTVPVPALDFAAKSRDSALPSFIASFSHPVHVDHPDCSETDGHDSDSDLDVIAHGGCE